MEKELKKQMTRQGRGDGHGVYNKELVLKSNQFVLYYYTRQII